MRSITILLNCVMDPMIYAYGACFFIYSFQVFNIKQQRDFLVDLVMNFINKLSLDNYSKLERFISHFLNMYFEYVDLTCSMDFKNKLLQKCGELKSSLDSHRRRPGPLQGPPDHAQELPAEELQAHHERVPHARRRHQSADLS